MVYNTHPVSKLLHMCLYTEHYIAWTLCTLRF